MVDDGKDDNKPQDGPSNGPFSLSFPYYAIGAGGLFGIGMFIGMYRAQKVEDIRKLPPSQQVKFWKRDARISGDFNPTRHAAKALAVGTALCFGVSGIAALAIGRAMGVTSVYEFVETVKEWAPRKRREFEAWLNIKPNVALEEEKQKVGAMSYDQEIEHWAQVIDHAANVTPASSSSSTGEKKT